MSDTRSTRMNKGELGRGRRGIDPAPEPPPTGCPLEKFNVERGLDNGTQRARRVFAEVCDTFVSNIAFPSRSVPSAVFVSTRLAHGYEVPLGFNIISATQPFSKLM